MKMYKNNNNKSLEFKALAQDLSLRFTSHTKFMYKRRYFPRPSLLNPLCTLTELTCKCTQIKKLGNYQAV